jgi:hypothetical protein
MRLGATEIEILQSLARDEAPKVSSPQRLRLEMLGLVNDTTKGLALTAAGQRAAQDAVPTPHEKADWPQRAVDPTGRKRMLQRTVPEV